MNHKRTTNQKGKMGGSLGSRSTTIVQVCLVFAIVAALFVMSGAASSVYAGEDTIHIVKPGESLSSIAAQYGLSVTVLARYNNIANINLLRANQALRIPGTAAVPAPVQPIYPTPTKETRDTVDRSGNDATPIPIATSVVFDYPTPTSTPIIATPTPRPLTIRVHIVVSSETLTSIGNLYGTTPTAIKNRNGLTSDRIYRGQRLLIP